MRLLQACWEKHIRVRMQRVTDPPPRNQSYPSKQAPVLWLFYPSAF